MRLLSTSITTLLLLGGGQTAFAAAPDPVSAYSLYKAVTLRWAAIPNAASYTICRATAAFAAGACPNPISVPSYATSTTAWNLVNGKAYYFRVRATDTSNVIVVSNQVASIPRAGKLNDTGIIKCANATQNNLPCPVAGFPGQDAQYGRDKEFTWNVDGHAGFRFTKINANGLALGASAKSWQCVMDNTTGMMWEVKTDDGGLHDKDNTYSWYNPDSTNNGGFAGYQNGGVCVGSRCDTDGFVKAVNAEGWCGYKDWRMPSTEELSSIEDLSRINPSIDTTYFPSTVNNWFWSFSPYAGYDVNAWSVDFYDYGHNISAKYGENAVRLVRSGQ